MRRGSTTIPTFIRVLIENITPKTAIAAANGVNYSCQRAQTNPNYQFLRKLLANLGPEAAQASSEGLLANDELQGLVSSLITTLSATYVAPLIASGLNGNPAVGNMLPGLLQQLDATTAHTIALALNANPDMTSLLLQELDPAFVARILADNSDFLAGMISNLDGSVIADAINAEYAMHNVGPVEHPELSLVGRLLASPDFSGADLAELLNVAGYDFLVDMLSNLDPGPIAAAINNSGEAFLTKLVAFLDPDLVVAAIKADRTPNYIAGIPGGGVKDLNVHLYVYKAMGSPLIKLGPGEFKVFDADIYIPPAIPDMPPYPWNANPLLYPERGPHPPWP